MIDNLREALRDYERVLAENAMLKKRLEELDATPDMENAVKIISTLKTEVDVWRNRAANAEAIVQAVGEAMDR